MTPPDPGDGAEPSAAGLGAGSSSSDDSTLTGAAAPASPLAAVPGWWGDLRVDEEIGHGAYGHVYRAWDPALAREVALKIIRIEATDPETVRSVLQEGQMLARVRHRNVVAVYGARQIGGEIGLWMEFVRGRSLARMIREDGPMAAEEAAVTGISLCHALGAVHAAGLLHRDVKAQNVMREAGGRILLMDFGAGRDVASRAPGGGELAGTPLYMPPEVLAGQAWSAAGDVYSLGALLYFLVTGRHPIEGRTVTDIVIAHGLGQRRLLADCRPDLPDGFVRVVERALAPRAERYATAGALLNELSEAIPRSAGEALPAPLPKAESRPSVWRPRVAAVLGAAGGVWLLGFLIVRAFDTALERSPGFSNESALDAWVWGLRSLVGPAVYMTIALVAYRVARFFWRGVCRIVPAVDRATRAATARARRVSGSARAQWLLGAQIVLVALVIVRFQGLLAACVGIQRGADPFAPLRPDSDEPVLYRAALSVVLLIAVAGWRRLLRSRTPIDATAAAAGIGMIVVTALLLSVPFRLVYENSAPRATYAGERCYVTGERPAASPASGGDVLLFCPDGSNRIRIARANDPLLVRGTEVESIFTARLR